MCSSLLVVVLSLSGFSTSHGLMMTPSSLPSAATMMPSHYTFRSSRTTASFVPTTHRIKHSSPHTNNNWELYGTNNEAAEYLASLSDAEAAAENDNVDTTTTVACGGVMVVVDAIDERFT